MLVVQLIYLFALASAIIAVVRIQINSFSIDDKATDRLGLAFSVLWLFVTLAGGMIVY